MLFQAKVNVAGDTRGRAIGNELYEQDRKCSIPITFLW